LSQKKQLSRYIQAQNVSQVQSLSLLMMHQRLLIARRKSLSKQYQLHLCAIVVSNLLLQKPVLMDRLDVVVCDRTKNVLANVIAKNLNVKTEMKSLLQILLLLLHYSNLPLVAAVKKKRKTESGYKGCGNIDGQRKTKCPCFEKGLGCATSCTCYNCINKYGVSLKIVSDAGTKKSRKRRKDTLIERFSAEKQIVDGGEELKKGHWITKENIVLMICLVTLNKSVFQITADNIEIIYRAIANKDNEIAEKSPKQFIGKLKYERSKLH